MEGILMQWKMDYSGKLTISGEGITEIGINTFRECKGLRSVVFPDSLQKIHAYAFWNCTNLKKIESKCTEKCS